MGGLDLSPIGLLLLVVTGVVSFALGRWWSRGWRARRAAKKLTEAPVKSQFGWHVIRVDDVRDAKAPELPSFEAVKPQIVQQLQQQKLVQFQQDLRGKAKVE